MDNFCQTKKMHCVICSNGKINDKINAYICAKCNANYYDQYKKIILNMGLKQITQK